MAKKVLITGGNKGIGLELTKMFLKKDYEIIVVARDFSEFTLKDKVKSISFDLSDLTNISQLINEVGEIDILINNAGIMYTYPYHDYPDKFKQNSLSINLEAPIKLIQEFSKTMKIGSRIVNNTSVAGFTGHPDIWYGVCKAGLINATKSFAKAFEGKILVNCVAPSPIDTDMQKSNSEQRKEAFKQNVISKRFGTPDEVAKTMFWLATDSPEYINGACIDINNGSYPR